MSTPIILNVPIVKTFGTTTDLNNALQEAILNYMQVAVLTEQIAVFWEPKEVEQIINKTKYKLKEIK